MLDILREAQRQFQEIHTLLESDLIRNSDYFTRLNEATQKAYVTMNEGMCANTTVCHQCAEHRDFLYAILAPLEELAAGNPVTTVHKEHLSALSAKVSEILNKISTVLASL